ncbi:unnamed protein product [Chrysoparadoxa australica]
MQASPEAILKLFEDNERVPEYNKYFLEGRDLQQLGEDTKVVWASSPGIFPFKPRDFCTIVHFRKLSDGTIVVINRAATHPAAPVTNTYVRAAILLGANIISPCPGSPGETKFTMITWVDPGGVAPSWIVNKIAAMGPVAFLHDVEKAAQSTKAS